MAGDETGVPTEIQLFADEPFLLPGMDSVSPASMHRYTLRFEGDDVLVLMALEEVSRSSSYNRLT